MSSYSEWKNSLPATESPKFTMSVNKSKSNQAKQTKGKKAPIQSSVDSEDEVDDHKDDVSDSKKSRSSAKAPKPKNDEIARFYQGITDLEDKYSYLIGNPKPPVKDLKSLYKDVASLLSPQSSSQKDVLAMLNKCA